MTHLEVMAMVRREILSIQKRDGTLQRSAYVWAEVSSRLSTLKPWEGVEAYQTVGRALRPMVEAIMAGLPSLPRHEESVSLLHLPPLEAANALGTKKHRHLRTTA